MARGELGASLVFFPLLGAAIGWLLALAGFLVQSAGSPLLTAAVVIALGVVLTGVLHLDGLMDTVDGLFGGHNVEQRLEIMRDSRVGSFAVAAGGCDLLLRFAALSMLAGDGRLIALAPALTAARFAMVYAIFAFRPARTSGLGAAFRAEANPYVALLAGLVAVAICYVAIGPVGVAMVAGAILLSHLIGMFAIGKAGGLTGDVYGAINEVVEVCLLVVLAVWWRPG